MLYLGPPPTPKQKAAAEAAKKAYEQRVQQWINLGWHVMANWRNSLVDANKPVPPELTEALLRTHEPYTFAPQSKRARR